MVLLACVISNHQLVIIIMKIHCKNSLPDNIQLYMYNHGHRQHLESGRAQELIDTHSIVYSSEATPSGVKTVYFADIFIATERGSEGLGRIISSVGKRYLCHSK